MYTYYILRLATLLFRVFFFFFSFSPRVKRTVLTEEREIGYSPYIYVYIIDTIYMVLSLYICIHILNTYKQAY